MKKTWFWIVSAVYGFTFGLVSNAYGLSTLEMFSLIGMTAAYLVFYVWINLPSVQSTQNEEDKVDKDIYVTAPTCPKCYTPMIQVPGLLMFECPGHARTRYTPEIRWMNEETLIATQAGSTGIDFIDRDDRRDKS